MRRTLVLALGLVLAITIVSVGFGTLVPAKSHSSPYFSALSNAAVSTAEACSCNLKHCVGNHNPVCTFDSEIETACCMQGTNCVQAPCFP